MTQRYSILIVEISIPSLIETFYMPDSVSVTEAIIAIVIKAIIKPAKCWVKYRSHSAHCFRRKSYFTASLSCKLDTW